MNAKNTWTVSDISKPVEGFSSPWIEFQDNKGEWHDFAVVVTAERIVFGGACNVGFLESGCILRDDCESLDETLSELLSDLETFYNDGAQFTSRIICNERM